MRSLRCSYAYCVAVDKTVSSCGEIAAAVLIDLLSAITFGPLR